MKINEIMRRKKISRYRIANDSGIPYMTLSDICNGKTNLGRCSAETVYKLSKVLGVTMEKLLEPYVLTRIPFDLFKSNVCHRLKELGDIEFLIQSIESGDVVTFYEREWYPESLYLLAMIDYISRINGILLCDRYDEMRRMKLGDILYPSSVIVEYEATGDIRVKEQAVEKSIPEFIRFNIVESEVRNVI